MDVKDYNMVTRQDVFDTVAQEYLKDPNASYESHIDMLLDSLSGQETEFGEPFSWEKRREILKSEIDMFSEKLSIHTKILGYIPV